MRLLNFLNEKNEKTSIGIFVGRFQPLHIGHLKIINSLSNENRIGYVFVIAGAKSETNRDRNPMNQQDRIQLIKSVVPKNIKVCSASSAYIPNLIKDLNISENKINIYAGNDRSGDYKRFINKLNEMGYNAEIKTLNFDRTNVSASKVRKLLRSGNIKEAQKYLPYPAAKIIKWFK